jgi:hypothetical protein
MWKVVTEVVDADNAELFLVNDKKGVRKSVWNGPPKNEHWKKILAHTEQECVARNYLDAMEADIAELVRASDIAWAQVTNEELELIGERIKRYSSDNRIPWSKRTGRRGEELRSQLRYASTKAANFLGMNTDDLDSSVAARELRGYCEKGLFSEVMSHPLLSKRSSPLERGKNALRVVMENTIPFVIRHRMNIANMRMPHMRIS